MSKFRLLPVMLTVSVLLGATLLSGCSRISEQQRIQQEWQSLTDTIAACSHKISLIVGLMQQSGTTTEATQRQLLHDIDSIDRHMKDLINETAERNKDNELGRYIRENYSETSN